MKTFDENSIKRLKKDYKFSDSELEGQSFPIAK